MRLIVVPRDTHAELRNERIREKAIVVETGAIRVLKAVRFKIVLCWSAGYTEYGGLEYLWALKAESGAQPIFVGKVGVYFGVHEIRIFVERQKSKVVVGGLRVNWARQEANELSRKGLIKSRGNTVWEARAMGEAVKKCIQGPLRTETQSQSGVRDDRRL